MFNTTFPLIEPILEQLFDFSYTNLASIFWEIMNWFMNKFDTRSTYFYEIIGVIGSDYNETGSLPYFENSIFDLFYWIAVLLCLFVFVFSLISTNFGALIEQKNDRKELCFRFAVSICMIMGIRKFLDLINEMNDSIISRFNTSMDSSNLSSYMATPEKEDFLNKIVTGGIHDALCILNLIFIIALLIEFIKTLIEVIQRYVVTQFLLLGSPIAAGLFVSRNTSAIFANFMRMYVSELFLLIMNRFFLALFTVMFIKGLGTATPLHYLVYLSFLKTLQSLDSFLKSLGLATAQTSGSLLFSVGAAALMMGRLTSSSGAAMESVGIAKGDFGLASVGNTIKSINRGQIPNERQNLQSFINTGGLKNADPKDPRIAAAGANAFEDGQYRNILTNESIPFQTAAIKNAMQSSGNDSFERLTGLSSNSIKQAQVDMNGTISGVIQDDNNNLVSFTAKPSGLDSKFDQQSLGISDGFGDNISRGITTTPLNPDDLENKTFHCDYSKLQKGQASPTSIATGVKLDNEKLANLGVTHDVISNGVILNQNDADITVAATNIKTGQSYALGTDTITDYNSNTIVNQDGTIEHITSNDTIPDETFIFGSQVVKTNSSGEIVKDESGTPVMTTSDTVFKRYMPAGATYEENSFGYDKETGNMYADWKDPATSEVGKIYISRPTPETLTSTQKQNIVHLDPIQGDFVVKSYVKRSSNESVDDYHRKNNDK